MGSRSHDIGAELRMHYLTVDYDTFSNEDDVVVVVPNQLIHQSTNQV